MHSCKHFGCDYKLFRARSIRENIAFCGRGRGVRVRLLKMKEKEVYRGD